MIEEGIHNCFNISIILKKNKNWNKIYFYSNKKKKLNILFLRCDFCVNGRDCPMGE